MKFKSKPNKNNMVTMISTLIMIFVTCIIWIYLKEYLYFSIFMIFIIIILHIFLCTTYEFSNNALIVRLGLLPIKIKYENIKSIDVLVDKIKITTNLYNTELYPDDLDKFTKLLKSKIKK